MECTTAEGATLNAMVNNEDIEEDSSHLLSSERAQNLRELRANRRTRISQLGKSKDILREVDAKLDSIGLFIYLLVRSL